MSTHMPLATMWWEPSAEPALARDRERAPRGGGNALTPARGARPVECIPVRSLDRIVIVRVQNIVRLEADDNYVRIWADRMYLHKETLAGLVARLDPGQFVRVHRSHAVRIDCVRELVPRLHGEYLLRLSNGVEIVSGRSYRQVVRGTFGLE